MLQVIFSESGTLESEVSCLKSLEATAKDWKCSVISLPAGSGVLIPSDCPHAAVNIGEVATVSLNMYYCPLKGLPQMLKETAQYLLATHEAAPVGRTLSTNIAHFGPGIPSLIALYLDKRTLVCGGNGGVDDLTTLKHAFDAFLKLPATGIGITVRGFNQKVIQSLAKSFGSALPLPLSGKEEVQHPNASRLI